MNTKQFKKKIIEQCKDNYGIIILVAFFLFVRLFFLLTRYHLAGWDESVYIGMGKYLYSLGTIGLWESIRPIFLPIILGAFYKIELNPVIFGEIIAIMFAVATIIVTYLIGKKVFNKKVGLIASVLLTVTPIFFYSSGLIMTEIPSAFFILLAIYMYIDKRYFYSGIFSSIAMLFRFPAGLIIASIGLCLIIDNQKEIIIAFRKAQFKKLFEPTIKGTKYFIGFIIPTISFLIFNYFMYRKYTANAFDAIFRPFILGGAHQNNIFESISTTTIAGKLQNIFYYIITLARNNWILLLFVIGLILLIIRVISSYKYKNNYYNATTLIVTTIMFLTYLTYIINKQERFILSILPIITIFTAYALVEIYDYSKKYDKKNRNIKKIIILLITLMMLASISFAIKIDKKYYSWQAPIDEPPKILTEYYMFFSENNFSGVILTTDPIFTVYSNNRFIPYYDTATKIKYINSWEIDTPIDAIVYMNTSIPCVSGDNQCIANRNQLLENITNNYDLKYDYSDAYAERYIFVNRK